MQPHTYNAFQDLGLPLHLLCPHCGWGAPSPFSGFQGEVEALQLSLASFTESTACPHCLRNQGAPKWAGKRARACLGLAKDPALSREGTGGSFLFLPHVVCFPSAHPFISSSILSPCLCILTETSPFCSTISLNRSVIQPFHHNYTAFKNTKTIQKRRNNKDLCVLGPFCDGTSNWLDLQICSTSLAIVCIILKIKQNCNEFSSDDIFRQCHGISSPSL